MPMTGSDRRLVPTMAKGPWPGAIFRILLQTQCSDSHILGLKFCLRGFRGRRLTQSFCSSEIVSNPNDQKLSRAF
jgi:hypothetical protein